MSNEELVIKIKAGIDVADNMALLYKTNKGYIYKVAKSYSAYAEIDDLMQEGYLGLCEAVERYNPDQNVKFITYAGYWFRQFMRSYITKDCKVVRIPAFLQERINQYKKCVSAFNLKYNREPSRLEISYYLDISKENVDKLEKHILMSQIGSLDNTIIGEEGLTIGDTVACNTDVEAEVLESVFDKQLKEDLWQLVGDVLDNKEQKIIKYRFCENRTRQNIADEVGCNQEWIRQIENKSLRKLRSGAKFRAFRDKYEQEICHAWRGSLRSFKTTWTSSTEYVALKRM